MSTALIGGQGINVLTQFVLPPLFLKSYGVTSYGEWLTLSATVSYLGTLNFGLQTFANNQAGIAFNRGKTDEVKTIQATALLFLLTIIVSAAVLTSTVFLLPLSSWLKLDLPNRDTVLITYLLGLQVLARMLFGFLGGSFLVVGVAHRGQIWNNILALSSLIATAVAIGLHSRFTVVAAVQLATTLALAFAVSFDLRTRASNVIPGLRYADRSRFRQILKPSGYFAMLFSSNFLVYQLPVLAMSRFLGATSVVAFSLTRTIYSMSRTILNSLSQAMGPEIVELYGRRSWRELHRLYDLSERAVFALTPVVSLGTFAITPLLMGIWLHKPELYNLRICFFMALISAVMGVKEHKYVFQTSANEHSAMARFVFFSYTVMVCLSLPGMKVFGLLGFLTLWLSTEIGQLFYILRLNQRLFAQTVSLDLRQLYRVSMLFIGTAAACLAISLNQSKSSDVRATLLGFTVILTSAATGYLLFDLSELQAGFVSRVLHRA